MKTALRVIVFAFCMSVMSIVSADVTSGQSSGLARYDQILKDQQFGVVSRESGLRRQVSMLQWEKIGNVYRQVWKETLVDSSAYDELHRNPEAMPLANQQWDAKASLNGVQLSTDIIETLGTWKSFRPNFSALPGNMSATFQPEGEGLGTAENPTQPEVGDLRIVWSQRVLPEMTGKLRLVNGAWVMNPISKPAAKPDSNITTTNTATESNSRWLYFWLGVGLMLIALIARILLRRKRRIVSK